MKFSKRVHIQYIESQQVDLSLVGSVWVLRAAAAEFVGFTPGGLALCTLKDSNIQVCTVPAAVKLVDTKPMKKLTMPQIRALANADPFTDHTAATNKNTAQALIQKGLAVAHSTGLALGYRIKLTPLGQLVRAQL